MTIFQAVRSVHVPVWLLAFQYGCSDVCFERYRVADDRLDDEW